MSNDFHGWFGKPGKKREEVEGGPICQEPVVIEWAVSKLALGQLGSGAQFSALKDHIWTLEYIYTAPPKACCILVVELVGARKMVRRTPREERERGCAAMHLVSL